MYYHIVIIAVLMLTFCSVDSSNQAISSISFHRDDVPLSYKYSSLHIYPTDKPKNDQIGPEIHKSIQYAPLAVNYKNEEKDDGLYTQAIFFKRGRVDHPSKKSYLEPREQSSSNIYENRQFIPGHNIETQKIYNFGHKEISLEHINDAYLNNDKQLIHKLTAPTTSKSPVSTSLNEKTHLNNLRDLIARKQYQDAQRSKQVLSILETAQIQPAFNHQIKVPQLHLNVARSYNIAHPLIKAPVYRYKKILELKQPYIPEIDNPLLHKTYLYPIKTK